MYVVKHVQNLWFQQNACVCAPNCSSIHVPTQTTSYTWYVYDTNSKINLPGVPARGVTYSIVGVLESSY